MTLPYFAVLGHGTTIPNEPMIIPPNTYLIRFSDIGVNIDKQEIFRTFIDEFIEKKLPDLFENHNTSRQKTKYGIELEINYLKKMNI